MGRQSGRDTFNQLTNHTRQPHPPTLMRRCQWNFSRRSLLIWSFRSRSRCSPMPAMVWYGVVGSRGWAGSNVHATAARAANTDTQTHANTPPTTTEPHIRPIYVPFWISAILRVDSLMISRRHFSASCRLSQSEDMNGRRSLSPAWDGGVWSGWIDLGSEGAWGVGGGRVSRGHNIHVRTARISKARQHHHHHTASNKSWNAPLA